jgi:hypothetical protein
MGFFNIKKISIDPRKVWHQMNDVRGTGGGAAYRDALLGRALEIAVAASPVNDPANAVHRDGVVGTFKMSWVIDRSGGGQDSEGELINTAPHAVFVEEGRSASRKKQGFSWTEWGGQIRRVKHTHARRGYHIAEGALSAAAKDPSIAALARRNNPYIPRIFPR